MEASAANGRGRHTGLGAKDEAVEGRGTWPRGKRHVPLRRCHAAENTGAQ